MYKFNKSKTKDNSPCFRLCDPSFDFDKTTGFSQQHLIDILATCCELDCQRGRRGTVFQYFSISVAIKQYNVISVSRLSWLFNDLPIQVRSKLQWTKHVWYRQCFLKWCVHERIFFEYLNFVMYVPCWVFWPFSHKNTQHSPASYTCYCEMNDCHLLNCQCDFLREPFLPGRNVLKVHCQLLFCYLPNNLLH